MTAARVFPDGRIPVLLSAHDESLLARDAAALLRYLDRDPGVAAVASAVCGPTGAPAPSPC
ncbi:hypothetical protein [Mycolicibacterium insubricum]|uniref:hypothetical protein n=1 Tax=Mycolicibacterium insubricum TaxID=444597 RepID=UPI0021F3386A|nr:hypothetical protein [Mycolicibacterium insubricum]MCV7082443.1 hypothetical protein [Mycolicibacterium insubricum]